MSCPSAVIDTGLNQSCLILSEFDDKSVIGKQQPYKIIRLVQDKGSIPSAQLISAKGIEVDPKSEEAESW